MPDADAFVKEGQLFGVPIEVAAGKGAPWMASYGIPAFIDDALEIIISKHTDSEGLFRLSGSLTAIKELKRKADVGQVPPFEEHTDVNCLTGLIKLYLRELPEPLLTYNLYACWKSVVDCDIHEKKHELVRSLLLALPKANYCLLRRLMLFFHEIAKHEKVTKMGVVNLATLIGPNLIWSPQRDTNDISTPTKVTWFMMSNAITLFDEPDARSTILLAVGKSKYDFTAEEEDEISLRSNDIVFVTGNGDGQGWLEGTTARSLEQGKFPAKYFEVISGFSGFDLSLKSPLVEETTPVASGLASAASTYNAQEEIANLKQQLAEEISARTALEENVQVLQDNFHDMVQIVIAIKAKQKEFASELEELKANPFDEQEEDKKE